MAKRGGFPGGMGGFGGGGNMQQLMKQAQKMQQDMEKAMDELSSRTFTASAGGGTVTAEMTGERKLASIAIKPEAVDPDDVEMLQDMILAAVNEALAQVEAETERISRAASGGIKLPGF